MSPVKRYLLLRQRLQATFAFRHLERSGCSMRFSTHGHRHAVTRRVPKRTFSPALVLDIELTAPLPHITYDGRHDRAWVLARVNSEPIGSCVVAIESGGLPPPRLGELIWGALHARLCSRFSSAGLRAPSEIGRQGISADRRAWPTLLDRSLELCDPPLISVVICSRGRPDQLARCLDKLQRVAYPKFEVVVVENVPTDQVVQVMLDNWSSRIPLRYVAEHRSGLSWARNKGIATATGDLIAFLDDDGEPDPDWLTGIMLGFARGEDIGCVTGLVLPARLETPAQELFEQLGGHSKGRGFDHQIFSRDGEQSPLFPSSPFGAGANMAFRREAIQRIGGFDVALGAGTPSLGGADTLAFTMTLLAGYRISYEPRALMWHHHRFDMDGLRRQLHGYSVGLTAQYAALVRHRPDVLPELLRLLPQAGKYIMASSTVKNGVATEAMTDLHRRHYRGMLKGPVLYLRSSRIQSRLIDADLPEWQRK